MGCIDGNVVQHSHRQRKRLREPLATIIIIGNLIGAFIDLQHAIGNRAANPAARLGHIKAARQLRERKSSVDAYNDRIPIVLAIQRSHIRLAQIQARKLVALKIQVRELRILRHIQRSQLVGTANKRRQRRVAAHIQFCQRIVSAIQRHQRRTILYIQCC